MKCCCLIGNPEIAVELLDLAAQSGEVVYDRSLIPDIIVGAKEAIEGCLDERRFCRTGTPRRLRQPCGHGFTEINANSGFHGGNSFEIVIRENDWWSQPCRT